MTDVKDLKVGLEEPKAEEDVQLPELPQWDKIFGRPTSLEDLDPTAEALLQSNEATILSLGDVAYLDSITTTYITDNSITTPKILAGAVSASKISVGSLSAISANLGTITAGTVTGALIRTSSGGDRIELDDTDDTLKVYDNGDLRLEIYQDRITFYEDDGVSAVVSMYASPTGNFLMAGTSSNDLLFSSSRDLTVNAEDDLFLFANDTINLNTGALADDIYIGLGGNTFMQFGDGRVYLDTFIDMNFFDITDGGTFTCVNLVETSDIRLKKNVQELRYGLAEVLKLEPIQFQFKERVQKDSDRRIKKPLERNKEELKQKSEEVHLGFSAQEVYKIMPELTDNADGKSEETARLYTTQMVPVLVRAIQELYTEVQSLKK